MSLFRDFSRNELSIYLHQVFGAPLPKASALQRNFHFSAPPTKAAILVPFLFVDDRWSLLFIRRAFSNDPHSGQVAFPGGRMEKEDLSPQATALRETLEEIGLEPNEVEIIGTLPPLLTVTNYEIHPVVGIVPYPYPFQPSPNEVQKIFMIPLEWLADPLNYHIEERHLPPPIGKVPTIYYQPYQDEILWGASAQIVHTLISLLKAQASPTQDEA